IPGCQNASNCAGLTPSCVDGGCVQCSHSADCPDWAPGCLNNLCNGCLSTADCPGTQQCQPNGRCGCSGDADCPVDVPSCVGADADAGTSGVCACTDSVQCALGSVCDPRFPYAIANADNSGVAGGVCIKACAANDDCATTPVGVGNAICETT